MDEGQNGFETLDRWLSAALERGAVPIVTHRNGDMDTVGSACALAKALGDGARACGVHSSKIAQRVMDSCGVVLWRIDPDRPAWPRSIGGVVVVDAASKDQVGVALPEAPLCVIDHHASTASPWEAGEEDLLIIRPASSSTAGMIAGWLLAERPDAIDDDVRRLLLAGIIADTGRFRHGGAEELALAAELAAGTDLFHSSVELMEGVQPDRSTRTAMLRSLSRCSVEHAGGWLVAITDARTHEGRLASSMVASGADVAAVLNQRDGRIRMTGRASRSSVIAGVDLGAAMSALAGRHGGEGGGHAGAAGATLDIDRTEAVSGLLALLSGMEG